jgi:hypothetical protein
VVSRKISIYDDVESLLLQCGELLFPFCAFDVKPDWGEVLRCWEVIIASYDRFMTPDEILQLYDGNP